MVGMTGLGNGLINALLFISYKQAMDYYELGYKPIVRLSHKAGAVYKVGKKVLIKRSTFEKYLRENIRRE